MIEVFVAIIFASELDGRGHLLKEMLFAVSVFANTSTPTDFIIKKLHPEPFLNKKQCMGFLKGEAWDALLASTREAVKDGKPIPEIEWSDGFINLKGHDFIYSVEKPSYGGNEIRFRSKVKGEWVFGKVACLEIRTPSE